MHHHFFRQRIVKPGALVLLLALFFLLFQDRVRANNHGTHIDEVMVGANGNSRIQFIVIQQEASGQNLWGPQSVETQSRAMLVFFDAAGRETGIFKFPSNPPTGGSLQTLIATPEFANLPGAPAPDIVIPALLNAIGGKVCFKNNPLNSAATLRNECLSYGSFAGDTEINRSGSGDAGVPAGPPAPALPIVNTVSLKRTVDTDRNSDFVLTTSPTPVNIAGSAFTLSVADQVAQGESLFEDETFGGNGRTCASCHSESDNFRLSPASVQARFASLSSPAFSFDPLFVGESKPSAFDAGFDFNLNTLVLTAAVSTATPCTGELRGNITTGNGGRAKVLARVSPTTYLVYGGANPMLTSAVTDGICSGVVSSLTPGSLAVPSGTGLEDPRRMRTSADIDAPQGRALIQENIDGFANPPVFRKSPHLLNVNLTAPYGFSNDIPDLQTFAAGAVVQHYPRTLNRNASGSNPDFRIPTADELAAMEAYMRAQEFPAGDDPNKFDLDRFATTALQRQGRDEFFAPNTGGNCANCHGGPVLAQTTRSIQGKPVGVNAAFNTGVVHLFSPDSFPCEPGAGSVGLCDSREFSTPSLFNIANLGPFFHNGSANTLSDAVEFYNLNPTFFNSPAAQALSELGINVSAGSVTPIVRFLEGLTPRPYTLSGGPLRFGSQTSGAGPTATQSITITNTGSSQLDFVSPGCTLTGASPTEFAITSCPLYPSLAVGQSKSIQVAFAPTSNGLKAAILEINAAVPSGIELFGVGGSLAASPSLSNVFPASGSVRGGDSITLNGTNFVNGAKVTIGGVAAGFLTVVNSTTMTVRTGAHPTGTVDVVVTNPDGQTALRSNGFTYAPAQALAVTSIAPLSGVPAGGTLVTVTGVGFANGAAVTIGGVPASNVAMINSTTMTATTGAHNAGTANVVVTNPDGQSSALPNGFIYAASVLPGAPNDFNADGKRDILWQHTDGSSIIWLMNGLGWSNEGGLLGPGTGWSMKQIGDFNGDGKSDILWQHTDGSSAIWLMNGLTMINGGGLLGPGTGWSVKQIGDFNGDGKSDILWEHTDGSSAIWLMNGLTMINGGGLLGPGTGWSVKQIGDFNGDGKSDILWQHTDGSSAIWLMNGLTMINGAGLLGPGTGWSAKQSGDFNGDGKSDILWQHTDGSSAVWLMNGLSLSSGAGLLGAGTGWNAKQVGDFNGDGKSDILWQHTDGSSAVWLMNGLNLTTGGLLLGSGTGWSVKQAGDFNGDGKSDILWQHTDGSSSIWLMNGLGLIGGGALRGPGTGWSAAP